MSGAYDNRYRIIRFWLITAAMLVLTVILLASYWRYWVTPSIPGPFRTDGRLVDVLAEMRNNRMVSVYTGVAAREIAGGKVATIDAPEDIADLAEREPDVFQGQERPAFNPTIIEQISGGLLVASDHDTILTEEDLAKLRSVATFTEYPREVYAVVADAEDDAVILFTDEGSRIVYVVPVSLAREVLR